MDQKNREKLLELRKRLAAQEAKPAQFHQQPRQKLKPSGKPTHCPSETVGARDQVIGREHRDDLGQVIAATFHPKPSPGSRFNLHTLDQGAVFITNDGGVYVEPDAPGDPFRRAIVVYGDFTDLSGRDPITFMEDLAKLRGLPALPIWVNTSQLRRLAINNREWTHLRFLEMHIPNERQARMTRRQFDEFGLVAPATFRSSPLHISFPTQEERLRYSNLEACELETTVRKVPTIKPRTINHRTKFDERPIPLPGASRDQLHAADEKAFAAFLEEWESFQAAEPWRRGLVRFGLAVPAMKLANIDRVTVSLFEGGISVEFEDIEGAPHYFEVSRGSHARVKGAGNGMALALTCALLAIKDKLSSDEVEIIHARPRFVRDFRSGSTPKSAKRVVKWPYKRRASYPTLGAFTSTRPQASTSGKAIHAVADHIRRRHMSDSHFKYLQRLAAQGRVFRDKWGQSISIPDDRAYTIVTAHQRGNRDCDVVSASVEAFLGELQASL